MDFSKVEFVIDKIKSLSMFENLSYYTIHLEVPLWRLFGGQWGGVPFYLKAICYEVKEILKDNSITLEEILLYLATSEKDVSYFFVSHNLLMTNTGVKLSETEIMDIFSFHKRVPQNVNIDEEKISCAIVAYILDTNRFNSWDLKLLCTREKFSYEITDYKLTKMKNVQFCPNGFIFDDKYYLYSIFIERKKLEYSDEMPAVFKIISEDILPSGADLYMRLDERLAISRSVADITNILVSEKFRGLQFKFSNTQLEKCKNILVHGNIYTLDKLLMVIKKDFDDRLNEHFWHIELEELPFVEEKNLKNVCVTFIHGKYYPHSKVFKHIDFIKNQYEYLEYCEKYMDLTNNDIKIDYYTTKECHYKIWCVENVDISEENWYKLSRISLGETYQKLLDEILENTQL